jgi:hypothetical protein
MQRAWLFLILAGCYGTHSGAGTFLSDVRVEGDQLVQVTCDVDFKTTHTLDRHASGLDASDCTTQHDAFPSDTPAALFAPAECRDAIERWQAVLSATPSTREQLWRTLSPHCQALIAGDAP